MDRLGSVFLLGIAACASPALRTVPRVVDGQVEPGPFVAPYAYRWFIEGEVSAAEGQHDEAAMAFEAAAATPTDDVVLMSRLAEEYEASGASRRADRTLTLARRYHPDSARVALAEGRVQRERGEYDEALASFARAEELAPTSDDPVIAMAETLVAGGQSQRASALLLGYLETSQGARSARVRRAAIDLARDMADAEALERVLALDARSTPAERAQAAGRLALEANQPALAARILARALDTPENVTLWVRALAKSGDREKGAAFLETTDSKRLGGLGEHVDLLLEIGEADAALRVLGSPNPSPRVEYSKGRALLARREYLEAAQTLAEVPFGAASFEASRLAFAECAISLNRPGAAAEALSQAPHGSLAIRRKLAEIFVAEGDLRAGLRLFDPKRPTDRAVLAAVLERAGHFDEAAAYYASTMPLSSERPEVQARASSEQLSSHGQRGSAIGILEHWTALTPDDLYARVRLVELLLADDRLEAAEKIGRETLEVIDDPLLRAHLRNLLEAPAAAPQ
ncbi:MAG: tetratricopeptide repeat protein [Polyangiales bacterium]